MNSCVEKFLVRLSSLTLEEIDNVKCEAHLYVGAGVGYKITFVYHDSVHTFKSSFVIWEHEAGEQWNYSLWTEGLQVTVAALFPSAFEIFPCRAKNLLDEMFWTLFV